MFVFVSCHHKCQDTQRPQNRFQKARQFGFSVSFAAFLSVTQCWEDISTIEGHINRKPQADLIHLPRCIEAGELRAEFQVQQAYGFILIIFKKYAESSLKQIIFILNASPFPYLTGARAIHAFYARCDLRSHRWGQEALRWKGGVVKDTLTNMNYCSIHSARGYQVDPPSLPRPLLPRGAFSFW